MQIPAKYILTSAISQSLQRIEASREVIQTIQIPPDVETNIRRQSVLKSSLFSARIEGNPLTLAEVTNRPSKDQKKQEIFQILKALEQVHKRGARDISVSFVLRLHEIVMKGLTDTPGKYRQEVSAIFNSAGIAIYMPPPPRQVPGMIDRLIKFANSDKEQFVPIRAMLTHYSFEKIHPFLDGNGRVGRLLLQAILEKNSYSMKGLVTIEEYLDTHRSEYYSALEESERDVTGYIEFMLEALADVSEKAKELILSKQKGDIHDFLLPRRSEILRIIEEHPLVNFDMIRRRFLAINERTLRYDLKKLQDSGYIRKRGATKGVYYEVVKQT
ncbi:MAG TPA: Fic family protein [Candidatus Levybacteria bacterium]|nr:Fic family protein [Candidatus Levybacteria bacterium]